MPLPYPVCCEIGKDHSRNRQRRCQKTAWHCWSLLKKYSDVDLFRQLGWWILQQLMKMGAKQKVGAAPHERGDERRTRRNRYRVRKLKTRLGTTGLRIPKLRGGSYFPSFLEPRRACSFHADDQPRRTKSSGSPTIAS